MGKRSLNIVPTSDRQSGTFVNSAVSDWSRRSLVVVIEGTQSSFSLIQTHFVKLVQLPQFDKTSHV